MRCGRVKRDAAGNESGETSWLARRLGLLPEGGRKRATPWIHSDVLALIARDGLGVEPARGRTRLTRSRALPTARDGFARRAHTDAAGVARCA